MSAPIARAATQAGKAAAKGTEGHVLNKGAKRDPELYVRRASAVGCPLTDKLQVLLGVMCGTFGLAGYYFGNLIPTNN
jgi:hypothetical protein